MDRTTTHHNQDTTVPSLQNPPSRIPRPRGVTVRPWPWRPEFFENHSRPGGQRRPLLLPHPPHRPPPGLSDPPSLRRSPAAASQPLLGPLGKHLWSPQDTSKNICTWCGGAYREGRLGVAHKPGSILTAGSRHIQTTQGLHPERPGGSTLAVIPEKLNQAKTALVAQAPRPQGNGKRSASTSTPGQGGRASPPGLFWGTVSIFEEELGHISPPLP